jgi:hypothetical protein
MLSMR